MLDDTQGRRTSARGRARPANSLRPSGDRRSINHRRALRHNILVYFGLVLVLFVLSWLLVVAIEPDSTWTAEGGSAEHKLIDSASGVAATLNNIGPGLGTIGATKNYANFTPFSKLLFVFLMMLGRLEIFPIIVLFSPGFWRSR